MIKIFWLLLTALPDIIKLIQVLQKANEEAETDRKVQDDVKSIHQAFANKDPALLNDIFGRK